MYRGPALQAARLVSTFVLLAVAAPAFADIVILVDGRKLEGEVKLEGDFYVITRFGMKTRVRKYMVVEIKKTEDLRGIFAKKRKVLAAKGEKATAKEWSELGRFAAESRLADEARGAFEKVVSLEPNHEEARRALGQVRYQGKWMPEDEAMALQGKVKVAGRWVDRNRSAGVEDVDPEEEPKRVDQSKAMVKVVSSKLVTCPACSGTGISVWIPCRQCENSGRPGYCLIGGRYVACPKCKGNGKIPGIKCGQCKGLGKYDPTRKRTPRGRYIPNGYKICPTCKGTGVAAWKKCLQCARSKHPGFCFFGERYTICPKCRGTARLPATYCSRCQRSGLIRDD